MSDWEYSERNLWQSHLKTLCRLSVFSPLLSPLSHLFLSPFYHSQTQVPAVGILESNNHRECLETSLPFICISFHSLEHQYLPTIGSCAITLLCLSRNDTGVYVSVKKYLQYFSYIMILQSSSAERSQLRLSGRFYTTQSQTLQGKRSDFPFPGGKSKNTNTRVIIARAFQAVSISFTVLIGSGETHWLKPYGYRFTCFVFLMCTLCGINLWRGSILFGFLFVTLTLNILQMLPQGHLEDRHTNKLLGNSLLWFFIHSTVLSFEP